MSQIFSSVTCCRWLVGRLLLAGASLAVVVVPRFLKVYEDLVADAWLVAFVVPCVGDAFVVPYVVVALPVAEVDFASAVGTYYPDLVLLDVGKVDNIGVVLDDLPGIVSPPRVCLVGTVHCILFLPVAYTEGV